jgi:hypothetical protein
MTAKAWFDKQWKGKNSRWMVAFSGYAQMAGNNGIEASHLQHHIAVSGGPHGTSVSFPFFLLQHFKYLEDYTERMEAAAAKAGCPPYTFQVKPKMTSKHWDLLQLNDWRTILLCIAPVDGDQFRALQDEMLELSQDGDTMYDLVIRLPNRNLKVTQGTSIYMPSQCLIRELDPTGIYIYIYVIIIIFMSLTDYLYRGYGRS